MITEFLSNKYNLFGLMAVCYVSIGYIISQHLTTQQVIITILLVVASNMLWYIFGVGRGMFLAAINSARGWDKLIEKMKDMDKKKNK